MFSALALAGCATAPQTERVLGAAGAAGAGPVELIDVRFFPQEDYQCGPAALATVLTHGGVAVTPEALTPQVYLPAREGSLQLELIAAARRYGRVPYVLAPRLEHLLAEIEAGHPVLVLQNLGVSWLPRWHYAVAVGFDLAQAEIVLRSGLEPRRRLPLALFERTWQRANHWAMVVLPPDRLPKTAAELAYLQSIVALESIGHHEQAARAYETALERWPQSLGAWIGLGNSRHAAGDVEGAMRAFRAATTFHPGSADAFNNLAHTLAELGRLPEAEAAVQRALTLGGRSAETYRETLEEIRRRRSAAPRQGESGEVK